MIADPQLSAAEICQQTGSEFPLHVYAYVKVALPEHSCDAPQLRNALCITAEGDNFVQSGILRDDVHGSISYEHCYISVREHLS